MKLELTFDANPAQLKKMLPKKGKAIDKKVELEKPEENNDSSIKKYEESQNNSKVELAANDFK